MHDGSNKSQSVLVDEAPPRRAFVLGSRTSTLARKQTQIVLDILQSIHPDLTFTTIYMITTGDTNQLPLAGQRGLWTTQLETALINGAADILVHSLKDMPTHLPDGCEIGSILERGDPADSLVVKHGLNFKSLEEFPDGAVVGTSSVRRMAQLKRKFSALRFMDIRGNLDTRLAKLDDPDGPYTGLILAKSGLQRYGAADRIAVDLTDLFPAAGQGALAVEVRSSDAKVKEICKGLTHWQTEWICSAERTCLRVLEGGCSLPFGVKSVMDVEDGHRRGMLTLTGCVTDVDGKTNVEATVTKRIESKEDAEQLGVSLAGILVDVGAKPIMDSVAKYKSGANLKSP